MKLSKFIVLLLILSVAVQANPHSRRHHRHPVRNYYPSYYPFYPSYNNYYSAYGYYRYYSPVVVTTKTTTTYPSNLVVITADSIAKDIVALNRMMSRGVISEKDYTRAKKTLLNRIGMSMNPDAQEATTADILEQIETLYQMQSGQLITNKEFQKQKNKLLAMI